MDITITIHGIGCFLLFVAIAVTAVLIIDKSYKVKANNGKVIVTDFLLYLGVTLLLFDVPIVRTILSLLHSFYMTYLF